MLDPFLKWAGRKSKSLDVILSAIGKIEGRFIEPFIGSGVVTLNTQSSCIIGDCDEDLINVYTQLKHQKDFVDKQSYYFSGEFNNKDSYYKFRDLYNSLPMNYEKALLFVYLNKHCFNGLYRSNKSKKFNVPFGKYPSVYFPESELLNFKKKLGDCDIYNQDFVDTMCMAKKGDVIYLDPPYLPLSSTSRFVEYNSNGFGMSRHEELASMARNAVCNAYISNHDTPDSRRLYENADKIISVEVTRSISGSLSGRGKVNELLAVFLNE